ncbi:MAG TPA: hypothetical protein VFS88_04455 [Micavibrio sp.]|nr:hypothetical protein [Micavibrio sp.]
MVETINIDRKELKEGIEGSATAMHTREFYAAANAARKYLGTDTLFQEVSAEFAALPQTEKDAMKEKGRYGRYGVFDLYSKLEVQHALCVVAREAFADFELSDRQIAALKDPDTAAKITKRFPEITQQRILAVV